MKFIHMADAHLGMIPDSGKFWSKCRAEEMWETFRRIIDTCNRKQVDLLLIAGDLFHRQPQKRELKEVDYLFSTLKNTRVVLIAGNHDYIQKGGAYQNFTWQSNVTFISSQEPVTVEFPELDTAVTGFSYHSREASGDLIRDIVRPEGARYQLLMVHGGEPSCCPLSYDQLGQAGFDYVALGHIHKPRLWEEYPMAFSGSLEPTDCNDKGERGYISGMITEKGTQFYHVPAAHRQYINIRGIVHPGTTSGAICDKLNRAIEHYGVQNIYSITLTGTYDPECPIDPDSFKLSGNIYRITDETVPDYDLEQLYREHADDVIGMFIHDLNTEPKEPLKQKAIYYGLQALLTQQ